MTKTSPAVRHVTPAERAEMVRLLTTAPAPAVRAVARHFRFTHAGILKWLRKHGYRWSPAQDCWIYAPDAPIIPRSDGGSPSKTPLKKSRKKS